MEYEQEETRPNLRLRQPPSTAANESMTLYELRRRYPTWLIGCLRGGTMRAVHRYDTATTVTASGSYATTIVEAPDSEAMNALLSSQQAVRGGRHSGVGIGTPCPH